MQHSAAAVSADVTSLVAEGFERLKLLWNAENALVPFVRQSLSDDVTPGALTLPMSCSPPLKKASRGVRKMTSKRAVQIALV